MCGGNPKGQRQAHQQRKRHGQGGVPTIVAHV
jgi:hypothetical protein